MDYERKVTVNRDARAILLDTKRFLMQHNFKIKAFDQSLEFTGPGLQSTHQNPILGISRGVIHIQDGTLFFHAELNAAKALQWFVIFFPGALALLLSISFYFYFENPLSFWIPIIAVAPWLIISPIMSRWIYQRTIEAVDNFLENVKQD